ncbi:tetratricopeptide repeat protein [bacterium]|nr:tetratricopeptide repeat protein [bacterium]
MKKALTVLSLCLIIIMVVVGCGKKTESAIWADAQGFEQQGQYAKAVTQYDVMLKVYPRSKLRTEVLFRNGLMNVYGLKDFQSAKAYFKKIIDEAPRSAVAEGARTLIDLMNGDRAVDDAETLYHAGIAYTNLLEEFELGVGLLDKLTDEFPDAIRAAEAQFMKGFVWANAAQDTAKARVAYEAFLNKYPDHELSSSVKWELAYLGKNINDIPEMQDLVAPKTE